MDIVGAGRLSGRTHTCQWPDTHTDEVFFRDTAHGFLSWAIATIAVASLTAIITAGTLGAAGDAATKVAAATAEGSAQNADIPPANLNYYVNGLYRGATLGNAPTSVDETAQILSKAVTDGNLAADDRTFLVNQISARTGASQAVAEARVDRAMTDLNAAKLKTTQAAETARKGAAYVSWALALSLVLGAFIAFIASVAGAIGGRQRDA